MAGKGQRTWDAITYDGFLWIWTVIIDLFFREIHPRSTWRIPKKGAIIFVAAPHANQFVDPLILMRTVRQDAHRRIAFLIAAKSMGRKFVGFAAGLVQSVPVGRALDEKKPAKGRIWVPDVEGDPTLVRGEGVDFQTAQYMQGGLLVLPSVNNTAANAEIAEIVSSTEIRLKKAFKGDVAYKQLAGQLVGGANGKAPETQAKGTKFSVAPHVDQNAVYDAVFKRLHEGGCIGIFPEGGSHDRPELLPLKAGLSIMALGALAQEPDCGVVIVPVGMNYFHAHKFRSRCVIEFGAPITVEPRLVEQYKGDKRRDAVGELLTEVQDALKAVTLQAPDYDTLMLIQAVRRLYNPKGKRLPLPMVVELQRRFLKGYEVYKDDARVVGLRKAVLDYNATLMRLNVRDHQVSYAKYAWYKVVPTLLYRTGKLLVLSVAVIPGAVLFAPVFIAGKIISIKKSREALAASSVKIHARDVVATWKILVSLALAPAVMVFYTIIGTYWTHRNRVNGLVPDWVSLTQIAILQFLLYWGTCFAALRYGEIGMDIFKSLRPLSLTITPGSKNTFVKLRERRAKLVQQVTDIVNELGPELFPDFDRQRIVDNPDHPLSPSRSRPTTPTHQRSTSGNGSGGDFDALKFTPATPPSPTSTRKSNADTQQIPRDESFQNIGEIGLFATRPGTPNRSRSRTNSSDGFKLSQGLKSLTSFPSSSKGKGKAKEVESPGTSNLDEVSRNLKAAMRERGKRRKSGGGWEFGRGEGGEDEEETSDFEVEEAKKDL